MADKRITELQLIGSVVDGISVPSDNGIQSYRFTTTQLKAYILAAQAVLLANLKDDIFTGLTAVTPADDDYFPLVDTSDSNKTKKGLVGTFKNAAYRSVTTTDAVGVSDETMKLSGNSFTSTLPTAVGVTGKTYKYVHAGTSLTQVYTLATTSSQTIGGVASGSYKLVTNGEVVHLESDGANWMITNHKTNTDWVSAGTFSSLFGGTTTAPTIGSATIVIDRVVWRRVGCNMEARYEYRHTAAGTSTNGSGDYLFGLPANIVANTSFITAYSTLEGGGAFYANNNIIGSGNFVNTDGEGVAMPSLYNSTNFRAFYIGGNQASSVQVGCIGSSVQNLAEADVSYLFSISIPVVDWQP